MSDERKVLDSEGNSLQYAYVDGKKVYYSPSCPLGNKNCIVDPMYIKHNSPEWWKELGCPTTCDCYTEGMKECPRYEKKSILGGIF